MKDLSPKFYSILLYFLMGISAVLFIVFMTWGGEEELTKKVTVMINWAYFLFGISLLVAIVFPVVGMLKDFKSAKYSLIGIGSLILIYVIGLALSTGEAYTVGDVVVEGAVSKHSEAGIFTFYVMISLAIGSIVYTEISKVFK